MVDGQRIINLIVVNVRALEAGVAVQASFNSKGGGIGSSPEVDWRLIDNQQSIHGLHCEIHFIDSAFCLKDVCGETYVNASSMPLGQNNYARLADEDLIQIGEYEVRVFLDREVESNSNGHSLEQLFPSKDSDLLEPIPTLFEDDEIEIESLYVNDKNEVNLDPLIALEQETEDVEQQASLLNDVDQSELDEEQEDLLNHVNTTSQDEPLNITMQADSENDISSAFSLSKLKKNRVMNEDKTFSTAGISSIEDTHYEQKSNSKQKIESTIMDDDILDLLEQEVAKSYVNQEVIPSNDAEVSQVFNTKPIANNHVLGGPLLNGLGVDIGSKLNMEEMQVLSSDIGATLQACIQGLLDLNLQAKTGRFNVMHRSLQPIEDNPLRLGLSYEDTVRIMFDEEKSIVHLSGAASVEESMNMIKIHNEAVQYATNVALEQILHSLSPAVLLKRFNRYSRKSTPDMVDEKSWAWEMYENYYQELTSNRQQGFEKLFWEIFEQSYDRKVREKHAE